ncbi:PspA/IM30 family protein [Kitasatospora sp. NPDC093679]|uniref:PspA/IM30 family protein n=1 Tax=Kitasatospora sp. NPDC093679 TaxID=3154983 RepID=UPI00343A35DE
MPGVGDRVAELFRIKANRLLDRAEDPREVLDFAHAQQQDLVHEVRRSLVEVAAARSRVQAQTAALRPAEADLEDQAQRALAEGHEDAARGVLARRAGVHARLADLEEQERLLQGEEDRIAAVLRRLESKVAAFAVHKEALKAEYTRADAEARVAEAVSGIGEEIGDVSTAVRRVRDRTVQLQARSAALEHLTASGLLTGDEAWPDETRIELERLTADDDVEAELQRLKARTQPARSGPEALRSQPRHAESGGESSA